MNIVTKKRQLLAAGSLVGLKRSIEILRDQLVEELIHVVRTTPLRDIASEVARTINRPKRALDSLTLTKSDGLIYVEIRGEGDHHVAKLPDGRTFRGKRRRDVVRRVRAEGLGVG